MMRLAAKPRSRRDYNTPRNRKSDAKIAKFKHGFYPLESPPATPAVTPPATPQPPHPPRPQSVKRAPITSTVTAASNMTATHLFRLVKTPEFDGEGEVFRVDAGLAGQVGDGAGDF